jgi:UDP-N-acetyl-D-glucosamine dehydrogenase
MTSSTGRVVIVGQGYVGLALTMRAVEVGYSVVGFDLDERRVKRLAAAESFIEDVTSDQLAAALQSGRYVATMDARACAGFDVAVIAVPTPLSEGVPDLSHIESAATMLARYLRPGATVVLESTTYPGTTEELVGPLLEAGSGLCAGEDFFLGYSPERIDPGNREWTIANTPKIVSGIDEASLVDRFYSSIIEHTVRVNGTREAELTKLLENTFRHVNVALVNELAMFAHDLGIDIWQSIDAATTKPFGYMRFTPGPGVGGHCLPVDPSYLSWRVRRRLGHSFRFVELANDVNDHMADYVARRVSDSLNRHRKPVNGSRVLLLGLAYKRNTSDARESPAFAIANRLLSAGAEVAAADPHVDVEIDRRIQRVELDTNELRSADIVVLLADHDDFDLDDVAANASLVLDTRHRVQSGDNVEFL